MNILKGLLIGAVGGFAAYKLFIESDPNDEAAKKYIALYKEQMAADSLGNTGRSLELKMQLDDLKAKYPNMTLHKYL